jgi:hypothetical protein
MRQISGLSSDDDGTDETLRERENVARKRRGDADDVLLGLTLMQRAGHAALTGDRARLPAALRDGRGGAMIMMIKNDIRAQRFGRGDSDAGMRLLTELAMMTIKSGVRKRRLVHVTAPVTMMTDTHIRSQRFGRGSGDAGRRLRLTAALRGRRGGDVMVVIENGIRARQLGRGRDGAGGQPPIELAMMAIKRRVRRLLTELAMMARESGVRRRRLVPLTALVQLTVLMTRMLTKIILRARRLQGMMMTIKTAVHKLGRGALARSAALVTGMMRRSLVRARRLQGMMMRIKAALPRRMHGVRMIKNSVREDGPQGGRRGAPRASLGAHAAQRTITSAAGGDTVPVTAGALQLAVPFIGAQTAGPATRTQRLAKPRRGRAFTRRFWLFTTQTASLHLAGRVPCLLLLPRRGGPANVCNGGCSGRGPPGLQLCVARAVEGYLAILRLSSTAHGEVPKRAAVPSIRNPRATRASM